MRVKTMTKPYYEDTWVTIYHGDCREIEALDKASAIVVDPPYELGFMGKSWDSKGISFQAETWRIIREACKSGSPLLSFGGTRTFHRIACAIEDAGWEIRDTLMWVYGSGFPKSLDISKAIDKQAGVEREIVGVKSYEREGTTPVTRKATSIMGQGNEGNVGQDSNFITKPSTPEAQLWEGYGTGLKPAYEPIILAMNPLDGTFANNALKHGVAGLNIDECRVESPEGKISGGCVKKSSIWGTGNEGSNIDAHPQGRFPANFIHDGSQLVLDLFPTSKSTIDKSIHAGRNGTSTFAGDKQVERIQRGDSGSAARFFYCAKASKAERDKGCEAMSGELGHNRFDTCANCGGYIFQNPDRPSACKCENPERVHNAVKGNAHPTVKPLALMEYLVKLVKMPEYNLIVDPFMGSGTTLLACIRLGIPCIGIDNDEKSCEIAAKRCSQEVMELNI